MEPKGNELKIYESLNHVESSPSINFLTKFKVRFVWTEFPPTILPSTSRVGVNVKDGH